MTIMMSDMKTGQRGRVCGIECRPDIKRRFFDIGLISGTEIECVLKSAFGGTKAYGIRGAVIAVRAEDCCGVSVDC